MNSHRAPIVDDIRAHIRRHWPKAEIDSFFWEAGPIQQRLPDFRVWRVTPSSPEEPWIYISEGTWEIGEEQRIEFFILAPEESAIHVETLAMVGNRHADSEHRLDVGHTVNIGRGWIEGGDLDHLLVSRPYPIGPTFEFCEARGISIRFLWLLPITRSEAQYRHSEGLEALEQKLDAAAVETLDPHRPSVV